MLCKEGLREVHEICNDPVISVSPVGSKLKAVGCLLAALLGRVVLLLDVAGSGGIGIILGECTVGDDKDLHILIKSGASPEAVSLISVDLIECFLDCDTTAFQFYIISSRMRLLARKITTSGFLLYM